MERARELIKPYLEMDGVIEDAVYENTPMDERQIFSFKEGEAKVVDYEFYLIPWRDFASLTESTLDLFHYPYQHAALLHDPEGRLAPIINRLAELPEGVRLERMTVHFLEFLYRLGRNRKTTQRGDLPINLALLQGDALSSLIKLFFLAKGSWPSTKHWSEQELAEVGISNELLDSVKAWMADPSSESARALVGALKAFLDDAGETFHHDMDGIRQWLFFTREGKAAFERWGCR